MSHIDFSLAKAQHALWNVKLSFFIENEDGDIPEASLVDSRSCYFGKWLYSKGLLEYGTMLEMRTLEKVHQELHEVAKKIVDMKLAGDVNGAKKELTKLEPISNRIVSLVDTVEEQIQEAKG